MKLTLPKKMEGLTIALGGDLKCRPVLAEGDQAEILDEIGDLAEPDKQDVLEDLLERFMPDTIVCDHHPGYFSTGLARRAAAERKCRLVQVQHHRAHVAAVCLEHGLFEEKAVGLAFDGTGYGDDGMAWGGEFFTGSVAEGFVRRAHFAPLPLPGGDAAVRGPWRIALALFMERGVPEADIVRWMSLRGVPLQDFDLFRSGLRAGLAVGRSTALGRWFDAVAAALGVRLEAAFEAQPAIELQKLAEANAYDVRPNDWPYRILEGDPAVIDFPGLPDAALRKPEDVPRLAYAFHFAAALATADRVVRLAERARTERVVVSGGVFLNRLFDGLLISELKKAGLTRVGPQKLPPGDQSIALGQIGLVLAEAAG